MRRLKRMLQRPAPYSLIRRSRKQAGLPPERPKTLLANLYIVQKKWGQAETLLKECCYE